MFIITSYCFRRHVAKHFSLFHNVRLKLSIGVSSTLFTIVLNRAGNFNQEMNLNISHSMKLQQLKEVTSTNNLLYKRGLETVTEAPHISHMRV